MKKENVGGLGLVVLMGALISLWLIENQSIRLDEAQSLWVSSKSVAYVLQLTALDVHVPLHPLLLHMVMRVAGTELWWARLLSLGLWLISIPFIYKLAKESANKRVAVLTVSLFALSPFILWYSGEVRMYSLLILMVSANQVYFLRLLRSNGSEGKLGLWLTFLLGMYTHYFFWLIIASQITYLAGKMAIKKLEKERIKTAEGEMTLIYGVILTMAGLLFVPWVWQVYKMGLAENMKPLLSMPTGFNIVQTLSSFVFGFQKEGMQSILISLWPMLTVLLFLVFTHKKRVKTKNMGYFLISAFLPIGLLFVAAAIRPAFLPRYLILVTPSLFFVIAWLLSNHSRKVSVVLSSVLIGLMTVATTSQIVEDEVVVKEYYKSVSEYLEIRAQGKDIVAISAPFTMYPIEYNYLGRAKLSTIPDWNRYKGGIPEFSEEKMKEQIGIYKERYDRIYLVLSYDQGYEDEIRNYFDYNFAMMERKTFPANIELRVYKLNGG